MTAPKATAPKKAATPRKRTPKPKPEVPSVEQGYVEELTSKTIAQQQAKLEIYHAFKAADLPVPADLAAEVEGWIMGLHQTQEEDARRAEQTLQERIHEMDLKGPWYVRNCVNNPFNFRLERQQDREKRRIELKPRGTPGDLHPLLDEDLKDPNLRRNMTLGVIEIVPAGEAAIIIDKQTTNMGRRVHTPLAILRNELGKPYEQGQVKVMAEFNEQGVVVATLDPNQMQGQVHDKQVQVTRYQPGQEQPQQQSDQAYTVVRSGFVPTGGNPAIVSQGGYMADNARAKIADDLARRKGAGGVGAGFGGDVTVTVEPTVRT